MNKKMTLQQFNLLKQERRIACQLVSQIALAESQAVQNLDDTHDYGIDPYEQPHIAAVGIALQAAIDYRDNLAAQVRAARAGLFPNHS